MRLAHSITQKIAWSTAVQYLGKVLQIGIGILIVKWVTQALGPDAFGQYGRIVEYVLFFSVAANVGLFGNVVRKMADAPDDSRLFKNALMLRAGITLLFFVLGAGGMLIWNPGPAFMAGMLFFMASLFFDQLAGICNAALQANYRMGRSVLSMTLARGMELGFVWILVNQTEATAMPLFFLAPLGASVVAFGLTLAFVRQRFAFKGSLDSRLMKNLFWTALPFGIINIINNLYFRFLPSLFMGQALSDAQFSFYSIALNIAMTASLFSTFLMFSVLPAFKHSLTEKHFVRAKNMFKLALWILSGGALLMVSTGTLLGPWTIETLSDQRFWQNEIAFLYPLLLILAGLSYFYDLVLITIFALEKESWLLKRECAALALGTVIMVLSLLAENTGARVTWVIAGALSAELLLVTLGLHQIRKWLK